jgi:hypothetical protein
MHSAAWFDCSNGMFLVQLRCRAVRLMIVQPFTFTSPEASTLGAAMTLPDLSFS